MESTKSFEIRLQNEFSLNNHAYLFLLYRPLIGLKACELYEILLSLSTGEQIQKMEDLAFLCEMSEAQLERNRGQLEKMNLLATFADKEADHYIFYLYPCMEPAAFLRDEVYARFLIQKAEPKYYKLLQQILLEKNEPQNYTNISKKLRLEDLEEDWKEEQEDFFQENRLHNESAVDEFDWDILLRNMDRVLPVRLRSEENMKHLAKLADFYGIDPLQVRHLIPRSINEARTSIDFAQLERDLQRSIKFIPEENKELYELSPVRFMRKIYPDVPILPAEKKFLKELDTIYGFSYPVANFLVEELLKNCHNVFNIKYGQKMAGSWKRNKITSIEEAKAMIASQNKQYKKPANPDQLPDWTRAKKENVEDPELAARLQSELSELFGEA